MEFLKELFNEKALTYDELIQAINAHNGNEENKDNQIKIANLGKGEYVGKGKFDALQETLNGKDTELVNANKLIEDLKKASKGNEDMQKKFSEYEAENAKLQAELQETKIKSAIKVGLLAEKCTDVDYATYKLMERLKEKGESLELDENDNIKGWDDKLSGLKTQLPNMFGTTQGGSDKRIINPNILPDNEGGKILTKAELLKKPYAERARIAEENPEAYNAAMRGTN